MNTLMHKSIPVLLTILFCLLSSSCTKEPLSNAENLIAAYDYRGALGVLNSTNSDDSRFHYLRALCMFVEGKTEEGFAEISINDSIEDEIRNADARVLLKAAKVIVREKHRYIETIRLLDSCRTYDPGLKDEIINLLWNRGLEYLGVPGVGGYYLIHFASDIDMGIVKRLRSHNRIFYHRYDEINKVHQYLKAINARVKRFQKRRGRPPNSMQELIENGFTSGLVVTRKGWRIEITQDAEKGCRLEAEALKKNPGGVLVGTVVSSG